MNTLFYKHNIWDDPFVETPRPPSHYYPTLQKSLSTKNKQTKIAAEDRTETPKKTKEPEKLSPKSKQFLDKSHAFINRELPTHDTPSPGNNSSKFDESWPSSERPSTLDSSHDSPDVQVNNNQISDNSKYSSSRSKILPFEENASSATAESRKSMLKPSYTSSEQSSVRNGQMWSQSGTSSSLPERNKPVNSTIAKYIDRFRYGEPKSREDRKREKGSVKGDDFWWLHHSDSPSFQTSTPTDADSERAKSRAMPGRSVKAGGTSPLSSSYLTSGVHDESDVSSFLVPGLADRQTNDIQRRADALIERSESSFTNESILSCQPSDLFTIPSNHLPAPIPKPSNAPTDYNRTNIQMQSGMNSAFKAPARKTTPEDDILYQWRLRRKLEHARDNTALWVEPAPSTKNITQKPSIDTRNNDDVESKLSEFRERLRHQEQVAALGLPSRNQTNYIRQDVRNVGNDPMPQVSAHRSKNQPSCVMLDVKNTGSDPIPQNIATQTNGIPQGRPDELHCDNASGLIGNVGTMDSIPVRIRSPKRYHLINSNQGVPPHLHMSCDIIPCHDVEHDDSMKGQEELKNLHKRKQTIDRHDRVNSREGKQNRDKFECEINVDRGKRERLPRERNDGEISRTQNETFTQANQDSQNKIRHRIEQTSPVLEDSPDNASETSVDGKPVSTDGTSQLPQSQMVASSPISSTIGKVVSDRLFSTPQRSISPCSSVDTVPSMHSANQKDTETEVQQENRSVSDNDSSGEFSDDELLQVLRQKRQAFEEELREIDKRLEEFND